MTSSRETEWHRAAAIFQVHREMHARVSEPVSAPARIRHSAYLLPHSDPGRAHKVRSRFEEIVRLLEIPRESIRWGERSGRVSKLLSGGSTLSILWEIHTEFYSYTTYHLSAARGGGRGETVEPFTFPALPPLGDKLVDADLLVVPETELSPLLRAFLHAGTVYGGPVLDGAAHVWTTFQVDDNGQGRYVVGAARLTPGRLGRVVRRLIEIENYYHLILLPLDEYRREVAALRDVEQRLARRSAEIAETLAGPEADPAWEHRCLVDLTQDFAQTVRLTEHMRYQLSAAGSYHAIFRERLRWLREVTGEGYQTLEEFLSARVDPAIRNYNNFAERAEALISQSTALGNMVRTRVSLNMERQNLATMEAMNRRVELQLILQRTVEGLSLIVLTYYLTGLSGYLFKALEGVTPLPFKPDMMAAFTIPLWLAGTWAFTRRVNRIVRKALKQG